VSVRPYDEAELGIGAADHGPRFAVDSKRLDDRPGRASSCFALEILGTMRMAALLGIAFGLLMLRLQAS
jgi:hypothetical protein